MLVRFYGELNACLPGHLRGRAVNVDVQGDCTVQGLLDYFRVPATAVDLILVNGEATGFACKPAKDDRVSIYPRFRSLDISPLGLINRGYLM